MELTIGTALQGSKYVIQEVLSQGDVEVMYKATHTYLDQPVLLRSLSPACQQRDDFGQVKQQFIAEIRSQVKQSTPSSSAAILDCFEEDQLPFVVLQFKPEQFPQHSQTATMPTAVDAVASAAPENISLKDAISLEDAPQTDLVEAFDAAFHASSEPHPVVASVPAMSEPPVDRVSRGNAYEPIVFHPIPSSESAVAAASNGHRQTVDVGVGLFQSSLKRCKTMPLALLAIALIGGCVGVGTGLALRFDAAQSQAGDKPRLSLFNSEQSFPSEGNWPIQDWSTPEPTIEQPFYRTAPSPEYNPATTIPPLPSETVPSLEPDGEEPKPLSEDLGLPQDSMPPITPQPKLPAESAPLPELGTTIDEIPPSSDRLPPISPDNLLPPTTVAPAPVPPPAADSPIVEPPPLKSLPDSSGI